MRIVVSDYDGTINCAGRLVGDVVGAVREWRRAGNKFGLATGRDFSMTEAEIVLWELPFDFLLCGNGSTIYDADKRVLQAKTLPDEIFPALIAHPAARKSIHILLCGAAPLRAVIRPGSWFPSMGIPHVAIAEEEAAGQRDVGQISLAYDNDAECRQWEEALRRDFGDRVEIHPNRTTIDINPPGVNKGSGIVDLLRIKGWEGNEVFVIGDGGNDLPMIHRFGGYTVPGASPRSGRRRHKNLCQRRRNAAMPLTCYAESVKAE